MFDVREARSTVEREAIYRLRYHIYIDEMGRHYSVDHEHHRFPDQDRRPSHLWGAFAGDEAIGTLKLDWGGDAPFTTAERHIYQLERFLDVVEPERIAILSRFMTAKEHRGGDAPHALLASVAAFLEQARVALLFCDCRPHLIGPYQRLGFRSYASSYNDPVAGLLVPMALVRDDRSRLEGIGSLFLPPEGAPVLDRRRLERVVALIDRHSPVRTLGIEEATDHEIARRLVTTEPPAAFSVLSKLSEAQVTELLARNNVIECAPGDRIVVADSDDRTLFIVVEGVVEVHRGAVVAAVLTCGEVFGEVAFLVGGERTAHVEAGATGATVVAVRQRALDELLVQDPALAAQLLLNLSRVLCLELKQTRVCCTGATDDN